jgi:hypothetical protein
MRKQDLLDNLTTERRLWENLLEEVGAERMTEPGVVGEWSVKDIVAHVTWYEREMVELLKDRALQGSELWELPHHERNAAIYEQNRHRSLDDVLGEAEAVYRQFYTLAEILTDEDLTDPSRYRNMPADWIPWRIIAENSYEHYRQHCKAVRAWLEKQQ